jgi:hypothetical protein
MQSSITNNDEITQNYGEYLKYSTDPTQHDFFLAGEEKRKIVIQERMAYTKLIKQKVETKNGSEMIYLCRKGILNF